jgi:hypothetical protein
MSPEGQRILDYLRDVDAEREARRADDRLACRVEAIKRWQHRRFTVTHADLLASPRYGAAARFFLDDLYGPQDFTERDAQFARVVPGLARLFPHELLLTVLELAELHAISERLDTEMALALRGDRVDGDAYGDAWRRVGQPGRRERQVDLTLAVGFALDRYTRNILLRNALRMMRGPARAIGIGKLQEFLESGFDTFRALGGAGPFLDTIATRERALIASLFAGGPAPDITVEAVVDAASTPAMLPSGQAR